MKISISIIRMVCAVLALNTSLALAAGQQCDNFYPPNGPFFGKNIVASPAPNNRFLFVSYNVELLSQAGGILHDLSTIDELKNADFILMQEATGVEHGSTNFVEPIAQALKMNYVFAPAMTLWGKDYGNAVLSRWPIVSARKVLLPPSDKETCNQRIALELVVQVGNHQMLVSSVHLSTRFSDSLGGDRMRASQMSVAVQSLASQPTLPAFISGDLNSFNGAGRRALDDMTTHYGFINARPNPGVTYPKWGFDLDHAYARGMKLVASGIASKATGSDHYPIWTVLDVQQ